jgi:hypothetical protein
MDTQGICLQYQELIDQTVYNVLKMLSCNPLRLPKLWTQSSEGGFKRSWRKHTKTELKGALKRAKSGIYQVMTELDAAKKLIDDQKNHAMVWKETTEDASAKKRLTRCKGLFQTIECIIQSFWVGDIASRGQDNDLRYDS